MSVSTQLLDQRIREFRQKYYRDKIIRGSLLLLLITSVVLFVVLLSEGLFGFSVGVRTFLVTALGLGFLGVGAYMVLWPVAQLYQLSKGLTELEIAGMVQRHFPVINDKLINLLQLRQNQAPDGSLAAAAIEQKAAEIAPVPIASAINLKVNRKYLWFLLAPLLLFLITQWIRPGLIGAGSHRLLHFNQAFLPPAPFQIKLNDFPSTLVAGQSFELTATVTGDEIPAELSVFIRKKGQADFVNYVLNKDGRTTFTYTIPEVKDDFSLYVGNPEVKTAVADIRVLRRPFIRQFQAYIDYPAYTGLSPEALPANIGDAKVLKGATIRWRLEPQGDLESAWLVTTDSLKFKQATDGKLQTSVRVMNDMGYYIGLISNEGIVNEDTVRYQITALADRYPSLYVIDAQEEFKIDLDPMMPLEVEIGDDFGFSKFSLFYRFVKSGGASAVSEEFTESPLSFSKSLLVQPLAFQIDFTQLGMREGDQIEYYLKVWDNDGVSGAKATTSGTFRAVYPTLDAKYEEASEAQNNAKQQIEALKQKAQSLRQSYKKMQEKLLEQKKLSFDDRKEVQRMVDEHQEMMKQIEEAQKNFEEAKDKMEENSMVSEETMEKMEDLNKILEDMKDPEVEKLLEEIEEKMENINPEELREKMEDLQKNEEDLKKSLERTLELLKQLEVQQKVDELRNKIDNLQEKQENLRENLDKVKTPEDLQNLKDRQDELSEQMENIKEDMKDLQEMKQETKTPDEQKMDELMEKADEAQEKMDGASQDMQKSAEEKQQGSNKSQKSSQQSQQSAGQKQQQASDKLQEMSESLAAMQMNAQMQQDQENLENLRALLENLLTLSFDQEDLRDAVKALNYGDPALKEKSQAQKKLQDDMGMLRDSLESLANRVFQIQKFVLDESQKITESMDASQTFFRNKQVPMVNFHQQLAMTSLNNLANMLSDVMKQLQQQMQNAQQGQAMCPKPGSGNPQNMQGVTQQQQKLNQQMQDKMNQGGKMDGQSLQEMAGEQGKIREQLKKVQEQIKKEGGKPLGDLDKITQDMIQSETELKNKQFTIETLKRQQDILSRLLQADKSLREREYDDERESKTAKALEQRAPDSLTKEEYRNRIRQELLKSNQLEYSNDFIILIEQYFKKLEGAQ